MRKNGKFKKSALSLIMAFCMIMQVCVFQAAAISAFADTVEPTSIVNLKTENTENPIGIDVFKPRFSWQMDSNVIGQKQTAYQVIVSSDPSCAVADMWDSGKVDSSNSIEIKYAGKDLQKRARYYWQVTVWDKDDVAITSDVAWFEMGIGKSDFNAKFIASGKLIGNALPDPANYQLDYDFKIDNDGAGFVFAGTNSSNFLMWQINNGKRTGTIFMRPHIWENGGAKVFSNFAGVTLANGTKRIGTTGDIDISSIITSDQISNQWNHMTIKVINRNTIETYVNGILAFTSTNVAFNSTNATYAKYGKLGIRETAVEGGNVTTGPFEAAYFANIKLTDSTSNSVLFTETFDKGTIGIFTDSKISYVVDAEKGGCVYARATASQPPVVDPMVVKGFGNSAPMFRKGFEIESGKEIKKARLYATSLGVYDAYINGEQVAPDEMFNPGWTDYFSMVMYQTYDVTSMLQSGKNAIGAIVGDGWYSGHVSTNVSGKDHFNKYGKNNAFFAQLEIEYTDGSVDKVCTDNTWKVNLDGPYEFTDNQDGETYNALKEIPGWSGSEYDDSDWLTTYEVNSSNARAVIGASASNTASKPNTAIDIDNLKIVAQIGPRTKLHKEVGYDVRDTKIVKTFVDDPAKPDQKRYVLDCGQNIAGVASVVIRGGEAGTKIRLRFAEMLYDGRQGAEGELYLAALRSAKATDYYTKKGNGVETYIPRFTFHGFRYIEVTGYPGELNENDVKAIFIGSELDLTGKINTSNPDVNQLYSNVMWSQRDNFLSIPTDCPQRDERLGWSGDAQVFSKTASYNRDTNQFYKKFIGDLAAVQRSDGGVYDYAPDQGHDHDFGNAAWADAAVVIPWTTYMMYGDKQILEDNYSLMQGHIYFYTMAAAAGTSAVNSMSKGPFAAFNKANPQKPAITDLGTTADNYKYILGGCAYGDWLAPQGTPNYVVATGYFAYSTRLLANIAEILGKTADAEYYNALADRIKLSFQRVLFNETTGVVTGNSQTAYLIALNFDLLPNAEAKAKAAANLVSRIEAAGMHLATGFVGASMLLQTLSANGYDDVAYTLLLQETYPSWIYSIRQGATTTWERWNSYTKENGFGDAGMNSFNHYSFGSVMEWVYRYAAGIEMDKSAPAGKRVILQPTPGGDLTYLNSSYDSFYGKITSNWNIANETFTYNATIPANTTAKVLLPTDNLAGVKVNGLPYSDYADGKDGVTYIGFENGRAVFEIVSGSYKFESTSLNKYSIKIASTAAANIPVAVEGTINGVTKTYRLPASLIVRTGDEVSFKAAPINEVDYYFTKWTVDGEDNYNNTISFTVNGDIDAQMGVAYQGLTSIALGSTVTSNSVDGGPPAWSPNNLTDGRVYGTNNGYTSGLSNNNPTPSPARYVIIDLGSPKTFNRIHLYPRTDSFTSDGKTCSFPVDFTIHGSNTVSGTGNSTNLTNAELIISKTDVTAPYMKPYVLEFDTPQTFRYIRVTADKLGMYSGDEGGAYYRFQLTEIGIYNAGVPVIAENPVDVDVYEDATATFTVKATGDAIRYQWYKDGVMIPGATSATLTISKAQLDDAGDYYAVVSNLIGSVTSKSAKLTVSEFLGNIAPVSITPAVVSGYAANVVVKLDCKDTEGFDVSVSLFGKTVAVDENGVAKFAFAANEVPVVTEATKFEAKVLINNKDAKVSLDINVLPSANIWDINIAGSTEGKTVISFNANIAPKVGTKYEVLVNGAKVAYTQINSTTISVDAEVANGDVVVIKNVKLVDLFPGFGFTFTKTYNNISN